MFRPLKGKVLILELDGAVAGGSGSGVLQRLAVAGGLRQLLTGRTAPGGPGHRQALTATSGQHQLRFVSRIHRGRDPELLGQVGVLCRSPGEHQ